MAIALDQLKNLVVKTGLLDEPKFKEIEQYSKNANISIEDALVEKDILSDEQLGVLIADFLKIPFIILSKISIPDEIFHLIPERTARKQKVIPFAVDQNSLKLAMVEPKN